jgi:hypothetical protein
MALLAALALVMLLGALPAHAQSIYGLSFRPTKAAPEDAPRGMVDIVAKNGDYIVSVNMAKAAPALDLGALGAKAFVIWAVDMDGQSHRVGQLDSGLQLEDATLDYVVAKLYLTAEPTADTKAPTGDRLYEVTLRRVVEVAPEGAAEGAKEQAASAGQQAQQAATVTQAATKASTKASTAAATRPATTQATVEPTKTATAKPTVKPASTSIPPTAAAASTEDKPTVLPTTGSNLGDMLVLLVVAGALIAAGLRLRTVRLH